jgi:hypothetical protein
MTYTTRFTVTGVGAFPMDMLRYDRCFPDRSQDAMNISLSLARATDAHQKLNMSTEPYTVTLLKYHRTKKDAQITTDRWTSFGWTVVQTDPAAKN